MADRTLKSVTTTTAAEAQTAEQSGKHGRSILSGKSTYT